MDGSLATHSSMVSLLTSLDSPQSSFNNYLMSFAKTRTLCYWIYLDLRLSLNKTCTGRVLQVSWNSVFSHFFLKLSNNFVTG
jgi:hypothetical protein